MEKLIEQLEIHSGLPGFIRQNTLLLDLQANAIAIFDASQDLIFANSALKRLLCSTKPGDTSEQFHAVFRGVKRLIDLCLSEGKFQSKSKVIKDKASEQLVPYMLNVIPVSHNNVCLGVCIIIDTDVQRLVEYFSEEKSSLSKKIAELTFKDKNTLKFIHTLFDNSPVGMMILDKNKRIVHLNAAGNHILGLDGKNATGLPVSRFYSTRKWMGGQNYDTPGEIHITTWDKKDKILMHCSVESIDDEGHSFSVETFMDVSSIENARLAAEQSNKAKTEFLANMSHELRTPLHTIMGFSECGLAAESAANLDKNKNYFEKIHHAGEVLLALVDNLLDVARLETGEMEFDYEKARLEEIIEVVVDEYIEAADDKNVKLNYEIKNSLVTVYVDIMRMQQVVRNLISNAIKFTERGTDINIILEQFYDHVQLRIYDQGPGIPVDEIDIIFDTFAQSTLTNTGAGGKGLGLSICREILTRHRGIIWAENNEDNGAVFIVNLYQHDEVIKTT